MDQQKMEIDSLMAMWLDKRFSFTPRAVYYPDIDSLHVIAEDCSHTEAQEHGTLLWLMERNCDIYGNFTHVGFVIECAKALSRKHGLPTGGEVEIKDILEKVALDYPHTAPAIYDIAIPILDRNNIQTVHF